MTFLTAVSWALLLALTSCSQAYADTLCTVNRGGECKLTTEHCDGSFKSDLCSGASDLQCCVPSYDDILCINNGGECKINNETCNDGTYKSGLCDGESHRECCVPYDDSQCVSKDGECKQSSNHTCEGSYKSGVCGGPADRMCCVSDPKCFDADGVCTVTTDPCEGDFQSDLCSEDSDQQCCVPYEDSQCVSQGGVCKLSSERQCNGTYQLGLCGGTADRKCCIPASNDGLTVTIVRRPQWDAATPTSIEALPAEHIPVTMVFVHHTATPGCFDRASCIPIVKSIQTNQMQDGHLSDIGYNYLVGGDGNIYEGRGWDSVGGHTQGYNHRSIAISFVGNFEHSDPNPAALEAAKNLIHKGVTDNKIAPNYKLYSHSQVGNTGSHLYDQVKTWHNWHDNVPS